MNSRASSLFERWTSGERSASLYAFGALAAPASGLYRVALSVRPRLRRRYPALKNSRLIVVSSPLVGGVGKTPLTSLLATNLYNAGKRVAIVTMGYGRRSSGSASLEHPISGVFSEKVGDEAAELFASTNQPVHVGDEPSRVISELDTRANLDWILFDDGISRRWAGERRVVMISDTDLNSAVRYLPFGRWRTTPDFVRMAAYVAVTSVTGSAPIESHISKLRGWGFHGPVGGFAYRNVGLQTYFPAANSGTPGGKPFAFCGIARPNRFRETIRAMGYDDAAIVSLPDHHPYNREALAQLDQMRNEYGCGWFLTTLKDAVKIDPVWIGSTPLYFLRIALHQVGGPDILTVLTEEK